MTDMWFVADANVEPDKPRSTISPDKNAAESIDEQRWKPSRSKKRGSAAEVDMNAKRAQMYEAAISFMQQPDPVAVAKPPPTDEDMFGQYVASQLKLLDAKTKLRIKVQINNLFFNEERNQIENVPLHNQQYKLSSFQGAQPQLDYTTLW